MKKVEVTWIDAQSSLNVYSIDELKNLGRDDLIVTKWQNAKNALKQAKNHKDQTEAALLATLGDAEAARCTSGLLTYFEQTRKAYQVPESKFRTLRLKKGAK